MIRRTAMIRSTASGFSLLEMMVAMAILALVVFGLLQMLDSSTRTTRTESALAEVQENVRLAMHHLQNIAAMAGGGDLPIARDGHWVAVGFQSNVQGRFVDDLGVGHDTLVGSDVLTLRGFFEHRPYLVDPDLDPASPLGADVMLDAAGGSVRVRGRLGDREQDLERPAVGSGLVLIGEGQHAVATILGAELETSSLPTGAPDGGNARMQVLTLELGGSGQPWSGLNPGGVYRRPGFAVSRVAVLDSYTYFVDPTLRLMRLRGRSGPASVLEPVAVDIAGLQVALGADSDGDGEVEQWFADPRPDQLAGGMVRALRLTVFGRTPFPVPGWKEPEETFVAEDMQPPRPVSGPDLGARNARWRRLQVTVLLRNLASVY